MGSYPPIAVNLLEEALAFYFLMIQSFLSEILVSLSFVVFVNKHQSVNMVILSPESALRGAISSHQVQNERWKVLFDLFF